MNEERLRSSLSEPYLFALRTLLSNSTQSKFPMVKTAVVIGSSMHARKPITTDLDLCFYIDQVSSAGTLLCSIWETLNNSGITILERPTFLSDYHNRRIECTVCINSVVIELTYLDGNLRAQTIPHLVMKDNFERHIGNLFAHGIVVYDETNSRYQNMRKRFLPYYNERLRLIRLAALGEVLTKKLDLLSNSVDAVEQTSILGSLLQIMLQYTFARRRVYPYSYEKWIKKQFVEILIDEPLYERFSEGFLPGLGNDDRVFHLRSLISDIDKIPLAPP